MDQKTEHILSKENDKKTSAKGHWNGITSYVHYVGVDANVLMVRTWNEVRSNTIYETIEIQFETAYGRGQMELEENSKNIFVPGDRARVTYAKSSLNQELDTREIVQPGNEIIIINKDANQGANAKRKKGAFLDGPGIPNATDLFGISGWTCSLWLAADYIKASLVLLISMAILFFIGGAKDPLELSLGVFVIFLSWNLAIIIGCLLYNKRFKKISSPYLKDLERAREEAAW